MRFQKYQIYYAVVLLQGMVFYAPIAALYRLERGLSVFDVTLIESISLLAMIALEIPMGLLSERIGYKKTIVLCNFLFFLSKLVFWAADGFALFLLERLLLSAVMAGFSGCDSAYLYLGAGKENSAGAFSLFQALPAVGLVAAVLTFSFGIGGDFERSAALTAATYGAAFVLSLFLPEVGAPAPEHASLSRLLKSLREQASGDLGFLLFLAASALLIQTEQTVTVFLSQLQYLRCGAGTEAMGLLPLPVKAAAFSAAASHRLSARLGEARFASALFLAGGLSCAALLFTRSAAGSVLCLAALSAAASLFFPLGMSVQNREVPEGSGRAAVLSVYSMGIDGISACASSALGKASDAGLDAALALGAAFCGAGLVLFLLWRGRGAGRALCNSDPTVL